MYVVPFEGLPSGPGAPGPALKTSMICARPSQVKPRPARAIISEASPGKGNGSTNNDYSRDTTSIVW